MDADLADLIAAAGQGSDEAFDSLYRHVSPRLHRYLRAAEPSEAEDLAADVWLAVAGRLDSFVGDENGFHALVFTIARRRVTDHRRRRYRRRTDPVANESLADRAGVDHPESQVVSFLHSRATIDELVERLPPAQADVVVLRVIAGLSVDEVAVILGRSPGAVRVLQHRGLTHLRKADSAMDAASHLAS